ncbi:MAG: GTPase Era [Gammaproteobacteria bacterium]|nr:GTPase Era [Gammaproteobacteria bacterium]
MHRSGFVAVVGRPNVGKSTLVNALVGHKISIVTSKPHTTRHAILGVLTEADYQIVFIDTPGMDGGTGRLLNRAMNKAATAAIDSADLVILVTEAGRWQQRDEQALEQLKQAGLPAILVVNKIDRVHPRDRLLPMLAEHGNRHDFVAIVPVSALKSDNLRQLRQALVDALPEQEALYDAAMLTNRDISFRAAETLREKLMHALREEVPYGLGVEIASLDEEADGRLIIDATIWVDRESHKAIVIGKGGQQLRAVGTAAREELQYLLDRRVHLQSHVKVKRNWSDNAQALRDLGYDGEM